MSDKAQIPAYSIEAEMSTLGSMILVQNVAERFARELQADDFFRPAHQLVFEAIANVVKAQEIDIVTLRTELLRRGILGDVGGVDYLLQLAEYVPSAANAMYYAEIVKEKKFVRDSLKVSQSLELASLSSDIEDNAERFQEWIKGFDEIKTSYARSMKVPPTVNEVFKSVDAQICDAFETGAAAMFTTGFPSLDAKFGGFFPGDQYVLGGYSGDGKTAMMCELVFRSAAQSKGLMPWLIVSGEMTSQSLMLRFVQSKTGIKVNDVRAGRIDGLQYSEIGSTMEEFHKLPIHIVEKLDTVADVAALAFQVKQKYGTLGGIAVDYVQMMTKGFKKDGVQEFDALMNAFKDLAKELSCSTLLLSQMNRESQKESRPPEKRDLKGSGGIEASSDVIMLLHRPNKNSGHMEPASCIVDKARFDAPGKVSLHFVPSRVLWKEIGEEL